MSFEAHGNINFTITNSCIINRPQEPFNEEGIDILFDRILSYVKDKKLSQWVLIELLGENAFPTPEAFDSLVQRYKVCDVFGCVKIHSVCDNSLQQEFLTKIAAKANIALSFYETEKEAFAACEEYLANEYHT
jgi:hypothetical protein